MKKPRGNTRSVHCGRTRSNLFDSFHDDIIIFILCKLSSTACCPSEFILVLLTCKRLKKLGLHPLVLSQSCSKVLAIKAKNWCHEAHQFLKLCVKAGNKEAYYTLGMIRFYCLGNHENGASLLAKAAINSHAQALYSLALILFNGSGGLKNKKELSAGVALCVRAAYLGHIDALRELGHCFQDGYGVRKNIPEGRRLLVQANARELASILRDFKTPSFTFSMACKFYDKQKAPVIPSESTKLDFDFELFSDYGFNVITKDMHPVNKFMVEWFGSKDGKLGHGLRMCSYEGCGRPETRTNEFRRCSSCGKVNYCSRGCQAHDWRVRHKMGCIPIEWIGHAIDDVEDAINAENGVIDYQTAEIEEGQVNRIPI